MKKILEVNVDDRGLGGVYGLVRNVIFNKPDDLQIDIAALERFEDRKNIRDLRRHGCRVFYVGHDGNKLVKQGKIYENMKALIREEGYDCVHIHADVANKLLVSGLAAKKAGVKKIILHSHATGVDGDHRQIKERIHHLCAGRLPEIGTDFATCSDLAAKWMFPGVDPRRIIQINNGIDLERFRFNPETREKVRNELGLEGRYVIGHVGRFMYQKNHAYLIRVFRHLMDENRMKCRTGGRADTAETGKRPLLLLVGEGEEMPEIKKMAHEADLEDDIRFLGLSRRVPELMQAMDVFVLPSHFEGLPIVGVEAQAAGLPVIFSDKITGEAGLTEEAVFLPITEAAVPVWTRQLEADRDISRRDNYELLKEKGYRIQDTVETLLSLYRS